MRAFILAILVFISLPAFSEDYDKRLLRLEVLGETFPGRLDSFPHEYQSFGMWAGIYFQTKWQHSAPFGLLRSEVSLWEKVNRTLTVVPSVLSEILIEEGDVDCSQRYDVGLPSSLEDRIYVCGLWIKYFKESRFPLDEKTLQKLIWEAHEGAIEVALREYKTEFINAPVPDVEYWFWKGWTVNVSYVAQRNLPTNTDFSKYYGRLPLCVLGGPGCELEDLTPKEKGYSCLMIRLALEENPKWKQRVIDYIALNLPQEILEPFLSLPGHCRQAKILMSRVVERY